MLDERPEKRGKHTSTEVEEVTDVEMVENGDSDLVPAFSIWNHNCVIIELASDPKPPVQTHGNSTRQATFEELDWNESETELERQARMKKETE